MRVKSGKMVEKRKRGVSEASCPSGLGGSEGDRRGEEGDGAAVFADSGDSSQVSYSLTDHSTILLQRES